MSAPVAIVDYGVGNLFSVRRACEVNGLEAEITSDRAAIDDAPALVLPGVGAFGDAMQALDRLGLVEPIQAFAASGRSLLGVCLGFQLLMEKSEEFGEHEGLGLIPGSVRSLRDRVPAEAKVPNIGWMPVSPGDAGWESSFLAGVDPGAYFYFVHSFYVEPRDASQALATAEYQGFRYCCAIQSANLFGCQFHPERSAAQGVAVYANLRRAVEALV